MAGNNRCNLCQSPRFKNVVNKFGLSLVKCRRCGLFYAYPRMSEEEIFKRHPKNYLFSEYLTIFHADQQDYDMQLIREHYSLYLQILDSIPGEKRRILDIGCGPGFFLKAAEERGWKGEGVEVSQAAVQYAKEAVQVKVHHGQLEDILFIPDSFDVVVLLDAVEHLYNFTQYTLFWLLWKAQFKSIKIYNLIELNPDYTHDKKSLRYKFFKKMNDLLKDRPFFQNIQIRSTHRILKALEEDKSERHSNKIIERLFRGDTLIAVARKS